MTSGYVKEVRPGNPATVDVSFYVTSIDSVSLKDESFSVSGFFNMAWSDSRLTWTPASYNNMDLVSFLPGVVWHPRIIVLNSQNDLSAIEESSIPMRVSSTGAVTWQPTKILTLSCEMDTSFYPFDKQTCDIRLNTFGLNGAELALSSSLGISMNYFTENGEWIVDSTEVEILTPVDPAGHVHYNIKYTFRMTRRSAIYWMKIVFPILIKAYIIPLVFLLPTDGGSKMGFSLSTLLAFVLVLTVIEKDLPDTALYTSILEIQIILVLLLSGMSVAIASFVDFYGRKKDDIAPRHVCRVASWFSSLMCRERRGFAGSGNVVKVEPVAVEMSAGEETKKVSGEASEMTSEMTCLEFAQIMDQFFFRSYMVMVTLMIFGFLFVLVFGASH